MFRAIINVIKITRIVTHITVFAYIDNHLDVHVHISIKDYFILQYQINYIYFG